MEDLNDKVTTGTLTAAEWNQVPSELQNVIENLGITLSGSDLNQLGKGIAGYAVNGDFFTDGGGANAYVLTVIGLKQKPTEYTDGFEIEFIAANPNTTASTVNVAALGIVDLVDSNGDALTGGEINGRTRARFDDASGDFQLIAVLTVAKEIELKSGRTNYLINSRFEVNQRTFAGGALTAGVYGFDRWKARTGNANIARSGDTITLTSGGVEQVIEDPFLQSKTITISAINGTGTITGHVDGGVTSASGTLPLTVALVGGDSGDITIGVSGTSVTFEGIQVEVGSFATDLEFRSEGEELMLAKRYFERLDFASSAKLATLQASAVGSTQGSILQFVRKRTTPTVTLNGVIVSTNSTGAGNAGTFAVDTTSLDSVSVRIDSTSGLIAGNATTMQGSGVTSVDINAEL